MKKCKNEGLNCTGGDCRYCGHNLTVRLARQYAIEHGGLKPDENGLLRLKVRTKGE